MNKLIAIVLLALTMTGCAEFRGAGYDVFNEPWGTVKSEADARCSITGINRCWHIVGGGGAAGAGAGAGAGGSR